MRHSTILILVFLVGCAGLKEARQEQEDIDREAAEADAALDAATRDDALTAIVRARQSRSGIDVLRTYANHAEPRVRREAVRALGLVGDPATQGTIEAALQDGSAEVRAAAAFGLSQLWSWPLADLERVTAETKAEVALDAALTEELSELRRGRGAVEVAAALVRALGEIGDTPTEDVVWERAADPTWPEVREQAFYALGMRGKRGQTIGADRVPALADALSALPFPAAWAIARSPVSDDARTGVESALLVALATAEGDAAAWMVRALGKTGGIGAKKEWARHLVGGQDPTSEPPTADPRLRLAAVRGAAQAKTVNLLAVATEDEDVDVAVAALRAVDGPAAWDALMAMKGKDPARDAARLDGLGNLLLEDGRPRDRDAAILEEASIGSAHDDPTLRAAAYGLLGKHPNGVPALLERVSIEEHALGRIALASAIAGRAEPEVEGQLLAWLAADDPTLAGIAAEGLTERSDDHITAALLAAFATFADPANAERRVGIVRALGDRQAVPPDFYGQALADADPHVRLAAFHALASRAGRSRAGAPPLARPAPEISDPWHGVADVERAVVTTNRGDLNLLLYPKTAPAAVANFVSLAESGAFDGVVFHRVVPDFVIQSGDPTGTGWGGPGYTLPDEFSPLHYRRGTLGMARSDKDTAGSQWFVTHSPQPHLTGHYTAFGQLMTGWDVLDAVVQGDVVQSVRIVRKETP